MPETDIDVLLDQLSSPQARQRAAAAKRLRRLANSAAGPGLLAALHREIPDQEPPARTWEVQYQLVMALAECATEEALPFVQDLALRAFEATMVYVALGDAVVEADRRCGTTVVVVHPHR